MVNCNQVSTPFNPSLTLSVSHLRDDASRLCLHDRQELPLCRQQLMYLAMGIHPDLAYTLQQRSQTLQNPGPLHWFAVQRAIRYLKGTRTYGFRLGGIASVNDFPFLSAYVDANYAMCVDPRRCISGYFTLYFGSPVSWLAKKKPLGTLSTTEASS
ncbi:hypothetical protein AaE_014137 [Aphanomyces astaci]|uniref:Reverse transcriptase Ty1/copia-type domain-containing protein n=1 Tax=Aphanomyces astaci TaxID=112090 RepID=A0A6A4Z8Q0_APHAT|nr:hypothetical protein AaE_014137 [Aphanomyces astaci]